MEKNTILTIAVLGAFNLGLLTIICWIRSVKIPAFFWLGWIFFPPTMAIINNTHFLLENGNIILYHITLLLNVSWGAYLYLFFQNLKKPEQRKVKINWLLFTPSILYIPFIILTIVDPTLAQETIRKLHNNEMNFFSLFYNFLICIYAIMVNILLLTKEIRVKKTNDTASNQALRERQEMLSLMLALQLFAFVPFLLKADIGYIILYMPVFGQIFFIYMFLRLSNSTSALIQFSYAQPIKDIETSFIIKDSAKYASIHVDEEKINTIYKEIINLMEHRKPYIAMNYSLTNMSHELNILPNILSMVINKKFNTNFRDFINNYRIRHALTLLDDFEKKNLTIESVAYESGFNNRTSFYNAFKKQTDKLPSEYLKEKVNFKANNQFA